MKPIQLNTPNRSHRIPLHGPILKIWQACRRLKSLLVYLLAFAPLTAWGVPLPVGDTPITGTTVAARPELAGIVLEDVLTPYDFSGAGESVKGVVQNRVVRSSVDATLDFYWRIIPDSSSTGDIFAFRMGGFDAFALDADWRIDGLGNVAPHTARNFGGGVVNFLFSDPGVGPTDSSRFFFLDTQATMYARSGEYDLLCAPSDCISELFTTFAPVVAPVPEPSTWLLFGAGLVGLLVATGQKRERHVS